MKRLFGIILVLIAIMSSYGGNTSTTGEIEVQYFDIADTLGVIGGTYVTEAKDVRESNPPASISAGDPVQTPPASDPDPDETIHDQSATPSESQREPTVSQPAQPTQPTPSESEPIQQAPANDPVADSSLTEQTTQPPAVSPEQSKTSYPVSESEPQPDLTHAPDLASAQPASIYHYPFDIESIRAELISLGESTGITHVTTDDGRTVTPDNASWGNPIVMSQNFEGDILRRRLHDFVISMPSIIMSYGGEPITQFTIYIEPQADGAYVIYYLY